MEKEKREEIIIKMQEIKEKLGIEILQQELAQNSKKTHEIVGIKYIGGVQLGKKEEEIYLVFEKIENENGEIITIKKYYTGDLNFIGGNNLSDMYNEIILSQEYTEQEWLREKIETLEQDEEKVIDLEQEETEKLRKVLLAIEGREVSEEEVKNIRSKSNTKENPDAEKSEDDNKEMNKKQTEEIKKVRGVQKLLLNKKVDGKETLGERLNLQEYTNIYVVYSDKVKEIDSDSKINNTRYSIVGEMPDGTARVLNEEFEMDPMIGTGTNEEEMKIQANGRLVENSNNVSVFRRKGSNMSLGFEKDYIGNVDAYFYAGRTKEENERVGIQIETDKTRRIKLETREIMNKNRGEYQIDKIQREAEEHLKSGCEPENSRDYDGKENTVEHTHHIEQNETTVFIDGNEVELSRLAIEWGLYNDEGKPDVDYVRKIFNERLEQQKASEEVKKELDEELGIDPRVEDRGKM